ncbi:MAG: ShlB/FhaC/HecB family hemolysin secretion/activation protein [Spirirestis rafaelensis WJT71-NPBG6]|jgi:hemolysin activation/secretion protein|nr:ShlB/FhaC/HecB family hemolysin secretion/activation protein [Spirirestis rafaelensis WJT71-NPBG6]
MVTKFPHSFAPFCLQVSLFILLSSLTTRPLRAQTVDAAQLPAGNSPTRPEIPPPQDVLPPSAPPSPPPQPPAPLPPPSDLLRPDNPVPTPNEQIPSVSQTFTVKRFEVVGSTVFSREELAKVLAPFTNKPIAFAQLLQARTAISELYIKNGYITSGAYIPPQILTSGVVKIQVVEGGLEDILVTGTRRLNRNYVRTRLALATLPPLKRERLLEALQLLQQNPLIQNLSAELAAGSRPGTSVLSITVREAKSFNTQVVLDNGRSPSVGSFRRRLQINEANLLGLGDNLTIGYTNTDGSNSFDASYILPLNPRNGTLSFNYGTTSSNVIERPFNILDIESASRYYDLTFRQPIVQTPTQEFALGLTASRRESDISSLLQREGVPASELSPGADERGRTRVSSLQFFQEWTSRNSREVIAARSGFNFGIGAFDATINANAPDSRFFSWQGQAQWVRLLADDTLLLVRGNMQLADRSLLPIEQFGLGGLGSVRGYRQDLLLTDNGVFATAEVQYPILRLPQWQGVLQVVPFVDIGSAWNSSGRQNPEVNTLASVGLGLQWRQGDRFTARLDWGIPLVSVDSRERTWQENGVYFSILYNPF